MLFDNFIPLNQIEELLYREKGLNKHSDGKQLQENSSIFTYTSGAETKIKIWINDNDFIIIKLPNNSLYGLLY